MSPQITKQKISEVFTWCASRDAVLKSEEPFTKAHGKKYFDWTKSHPTTSKNFKDAFINSSIHFIPLILSEYHGFESVHKLVDVGGSSGMMLAGIVEKYPHIQAVNFDLPEVVANNPSLPGKQLATMSSHFKIWSHSLMSNIMRVYIWQTLKSPTNFKGCQIRAGAALP